MEKNNKKRESRNNQPFNLIPVYQTAVAIAACLPEAFNFYSFLHIRLKCKFLSSSQYLFEAEIGYHENEHK